MKDLHVDGKKMNKNGSKMAIYESESFSFFSFKIAKKKEMKKNVFYVVAFDPIKI